MKNKKSLMSMEVVVKSVVLFAVLLLLVLFMNRTLGDTQFSFLSGQTERTTQDCDEDDFTGITDSCPCNPDITEKEDNQRCGTPSDLAENNCPKLCKK